MNIGVNGGVIFKNVATRPTGSTSPMIVTTIRKVAVESNYPVVSYQMGSLFWDDRYFGIQKHLKQHNEDIAITSVVRTQLTLMDSFFFAVWMRELSGYLSTADLFSLFESDLCFRNPFTFWQCDNSFA